MRAVIFGNGSITDYGRVKALLNDDDYIICADGGLRHTAVLGIRPDVAIGDFDSSEKDDSVKTYVYPSRKDFTDGELAIDYAIENGYEDILMFAMTGSRIDHTLTDILLLSKCRGARIIDDKNEIRILNGKLELNGYNGKTLSIIPVYGELCGITATGVEYPMDNDTLFFGESRGNSNVINEDVCTITAKRGIAVIVINDGE